MVCSAAAACALCFVTLVAGCDAHPQTTVVVDNKYAPSPTSLVIYRAYWQAVSFLDPIPPGASSDAQSTVPASANTAYVVLAPGWDPDASTPPTSLVVMQSRNGFEVHLNDTLHIPVDDTTFAGNCPSGSFLSQAQADFITQLIFPDDASLGYNAMSCTTTPSADDAGGQ
ncbi:MAG TPA: hypothetical protein VGY54_01380 [Polyangiaceae bacterium]|jgi:hypothetical protein|nr:hypothetical protein [Polyangiaceae bacterium]